MTDVPPPLDEVDEKLADHREWLKKQRLMRTTIAPVNVEAVGDLVAGFERLARGWAAQELRADSAEARVAELEQHERRFYSADGSFVEMESAEAVIAARIEAAKRLEQLEHEKEAMLNLLREHRALPASCPPVGASDEQIAAHLNKVSDWEQRRDTLLDW